MVSLSNRECVLAKPQYSGPWRRIRAEVLERDDYTCQIRYPGCRITANQVDHIYPVAEHGHTFDPALLRAACRHCNNARNRKNPLPTPSRRW